MFVNKFSLVNNSLLFQKKDESEKLKQYQQLWLQKQERERQEKEKKAAELLLQRGKLRPGGTYMNLVRNAFGIPV